VRGNGLLIFSGGTFEVDPEEEKKRQEMKKLLDWIKDNIYAGRYFVIRTKGLYLIRI